MIDAIRVLTMDAVEKAECGHPGAPMGLAPLGYELFCRHLQHDPANPDWMNRDRFVLSAGHASMLLYSLLHLTGYELELDELRDFRQWGARTPGHPEHGLTPGVETTTGPLGQGLANSVGMALAERWLAHHFNKPGHNVVDHWTYALCSDGDLMEGVSHEAASFAGHQRLGKLVWIHDDNSVTIEGSTDLATSTDQEQRFEAYGWQVLKVDDGNDCVAIARALRGARRELERPSLIILKTTIAFGSPNKAGSHEAHGAPLGRDEVRATKVALEYPSAEPFFVHPRARSEWDKIKERGHALSSDWHKRFLAYRHEHSAEALEFLRLMNGVLPPGLEAASESIVGAAREMATRTASGIVLQDLAKRLPELVGGSADLGGSNNTTIEGAEDLGADTPGGRVLHFGVREHAMGGILSGMALHGGLRVFGGTFLVFSDYMRPAIRLASLMGQRVVYVFTHDSVGLGEDGPTHQPVEHLMSLRAIPGLLDLRPADAAEVAVAWRLALTRKDGPSFLALSRQKVRNLERGEDTGLASAEETVRGAYVLAEAFGGEPAAILVASGSEVQVALDAQTILQGKGYPVRLVSMPSWALFRNQDRAYQESVFPPSCKVRVSVEAGSTMGWHRWLGEEGLAIGLDRFGASAPWPILYDEFGFTAGQVAERVQELLPSQGE
jgi:transketolase